MIPIVKYESWTNRSKHTFDLTEKIMAEIYPNLSTSSIKKKLESVKLGKLTIEEIIKDAQKNNIVFNWYHEEEYNGFSKRPSDISYEIDEEEF